jgi:hypothetical protein
MILILFLIMDIHEQLVGPFAKIIIARKLVPTELYNTLKKKELRGISVTSLDVPKECKMYTNDKFL